MTFSSVLQADLAVFFNTAEFASTGVYFDRRGGEKTIYCIMTPLGDLTGYTTGQARTAEIYLKKEDIPHPEIYDEILIESRRWKIDQILQEQQTVFKVLASSDQRSRTSG